MQLQKLDEYVDQALEIYKQFTIPLRVDKVNSIYYCYNNNTNDFVCQGKSIEEITEAFKARYPNHGSYILNKYLDLFPGQTSKGTITDEPSDADLRKDIEDEIKAKVGSE